MSRSDGYAMVGGNVQGARIFDPVSGQWLTPDPYAGDVRDLMSQKPFMWNNNNPVQWGDPSGYEGCLTGSGLCGASITPVPPNPNQYTQLEVNAVIVTVSITAVNKGLIWSVGTGPGVGSKDGEFKLGFGAGLFSGSFFPNPGKTPEDVGTGPSVGVSGGYVFGAQAFGNSNGYALGAGLVTPGFSVSDTTGTLVKFDWGQLFPVNGAQLPAPPQSSPDKSQTTP